MGKNLEFSVYEIVGSQFCVASDDGQKVYDRLVKAFNEEQKVILSFRNVTALTSAFLNTAIGQLYGTFTEEKIRALLSVDEIEQDDLALLKRVVDSAKLYFKDPERFEQAMKDTFEDDNDDDV